MTEAGPAPHDASANGAGSGSQLTDPMAPACPPHLMPGERHDSKITIGKMFVGGLGSAVAEEDLRRYFSAYGEVLDVMVMRDKITGKDRGFGFVTFLDGSVVGRAIGRRHDINGRSIEAKSCVPRSEQDTQSRSQGQGTDHKGDQDIRKIFVGGISPAVGEDELRDYFSAYGVVTDVQLMVDRDTGRPRGFGFITFEDATVVDSILLKRDHVLQGKAVDVKKAFPRSSVTSAPAHPGMAGGFAGYPPMVDPRMMHHYPGMYPPPGYPPMPMMPPMPVDPYYGHMAAYMPAYPQAAPPSQAAAASYSDPYAQPQTYAAPAATAATMAPAATTAPAASAAPPYAAGAAHDPYAAYAAYGWPQVAAGGYAAPPAAGAYAPPAAGAYAAAPTTGGYAPPAAGGYAAAPATSAYTTPASAPEADPAGERYASAPAAASEAGGYAATTAPAAGTLAPATAAPAVSSYASSPTCTLAAAPATVPAGAYAQYAQEAYTAPSAGGIDMAYATAAGGATGTAGVAGETDAAGQAGADRRAGEDRRYHPYGR